MADNEPNPKENNGNRKGCPKSGHSQNLYFSGSHVSQLLIGVNVKRRPFHAAPQDGTRLPLVQ